jgi:hypothetical protein
LAQNLKSAEKLAQWKPYQIVEKSFFLSCLGKASLGEFFGRFWLATLPGRTPGGGIHTEVGTKISLEFGDRRELRQTIGDWRIIERRY